MMMMMMMMMVMMVVVMMMVVVVMMVMYQYIARKGKSWERHAKEHDGTSCNTNEDLTKLRLGDILPYRSFSPTYSNRFHYHRWITVLSMQFPQFPRILRLKRWSNLRCTSSDRGLETMLPGQRRRWRHKAHAIQKKTKAGTKAGALLV